MRLSTFPDPLLLKEQYLYDSRKILKESCEGLTKEQRLVVENIYKHFSPLIEATLTAQQIGQLFGEVEKTAAASGNNKTALGKAAGAVGAAAKGGAEAVKKANDILNRAGTWLKNTTPVQNFDGKFNELKGKVVDKLGGEDSKIVQQVEKLGKLAKDNPGKTAAVIGVLTVLAGLAAGPVGGMVAGQVLRGASELIQGGDLSTAIGKGAKAAAIGAVAGGVGDAVAGDEVDAVAGGGEETGSSEPQASTQSSSIQSASTIDDAKAAAAQSIENGASIKRVGQEYAQKVLQLKVQNGEITDWNSYRRAIEDIGNSLKEIDPSSTYRDRQFITGTTDHYVGRIVARDAGGNWSGSGPEKIAKFIEIMSRGKQESVYRQTRPLSEGQVYFLFNRVEQLNEGPLWDKLKDQGKKAAAAAKDKAAEIGSNLTNKVTASKLNAAWKKEESPTDSNELAEFLKRQGISDDVIQQVYQTMNIEMPAGQQQEPEQDQEQLDKPDQQPEQPQAQQQVDAVPSVKLVIEKIKKLAPKDKTALLQDLKQELGTA